jgi:hypothetical protein
MKLESIMTFLNKSGIHTFYPFMFPTGSGVCSVIDIPGGTVERGGVQKAYLRILTRESHPSIAVAKAAETKEYLFSEMKGAFFDGKQVLQIETDQPEALFIGEENGLYTVSMNYTLLKG